MYSIRRNEVVLGNCWTISCCLQAIKDQPPLYACSPRSLPRSSKLTTRTTLNRYCTSQTFIFRPVSVLIVVASFSRRLSNIPQSEFSVVFTLPNVLSLREYRGWTTSASESQLACQACSKSHPQLDQRSKLAAECQLPRTSSVSEGLSGPLRKALYLAIAWSMPHTCMFSMCCSWRRGGSPPRAPNDRLSRRLSCLLYNLTLWLTGICSPDSLIAGSCRQKSCHFSSSFLLKLCQADVGQIQHLWLVRILHDPSKQKRKILHSLEGLIEDA